jgi:long-chain acyl-CoA synthetase
MNLGLMLSRIARQEPARPSVFMGTKAIWNYGQLHHRAMVIARALADRGYAPQARVAIWMKNAPDYLPLLFGIWYAGLVAVPINAKLHPREVEYILSDCHASALFVSGSHQPSTLKLCLPRGCAEFTETDIDAWAFEAECEYEPTACEADALAWLFYTSGTTGRPKGVMLSHRNLHAMVACYFSGIDSIDGDEAVVHAAPMSHGAGLYALPFVLKGARHVIPESAGFEPEELLSLANGLGKVVLFAAPTMVKRLVRYVRDSAVAASGFKTIIYGGGPMYLEDIKDALATMGPCFVQLYGQGESPMTITSLTKAQIADASARGDDERLGSVGTAQALVEVRVADAQGLALPAGEIGEIQVRGLPVMRGYWNNSQATEQALRDGWLFTGDLGSFCADGFLALRDRSKDLIISGGSNIYPREVEDVLLMHPGVLEAAVVGRSDPEWGEEVFAFIVKASGHEVDEAELDRLCLDRLARFKRPKAYRFIEGLPKNNYGKVLKTELRSFVK